MEYQKKQEEKGEFFMFGVEGIVKPILEEMGLFKGVEVSVKEAFEKYLKSNPKGIGPLWKFKVIVAHELNLGVREVKNGDQIEFLFSFDPANDLLNYDPRHSQDRQSPEES